MTYSVTLEHGSDGSYLAWVEELPGCFVRGASRNEAIDNTEITTAVVAEVESVVEADEDTEVLLDADRRPLTSDHWETIARWLSYSRRDVVGALATLADDELEWQPGGRSRTLRE